MLSPVNINTAGEVTEAGDGREAPECSALLSSAVEYIDALERNRCRDCWEERCLAGKQINRRTKRQITEVIHQ